MGRLIYYRKNGKSSSIALYARLSQAPNYILKAMLLAIIWREQYGETS